MRLELKDLHVHYGKIEAIKGISVVVNEGEIVTLIGSNGAGNQMFIVDANVTSSSSSSLVVGGGGANNNQCNQRRENKNCVKRLTIGEPVQITSNSNIIMNHKKQTRRRYK